MTLLRRVAIFLILGVVAFPAAPASASHFRYATITWFATDDAHPFVVTIRLEAAFRRSFFSPLPVVGGLVNVQSAGSSFKVVNAGTNALITTLPTIATVTTVNAAEDWFTAVVTAGPITLPSAVTSYKIIFTDCCRLSTLRDGNSDGLLTLTSRMVIERVNRAGTSRANRPPVSGILPVVTLRRGAPNTFFVPASDPDGDALTFAFSPTGTGPFGSGLGTQFPSGMTMTAGGQVTWTPALAGVYATQITVTDPHNTLVPNGITSVPNGITSVPIDITLNVIDAPAGDPPTALIDDGAEAASFTVLAGTPLTFTVKGRDTDLDPATGLPNSFVTLSSGSLPTGAAMTPSLPFNGRSTVSSTFNWTPGPSAAGTYNLSFAATDGSGLQDLNSATITVLANSRPVVGCPLTLPSFPATSAAGADVPLDFTLDDADHDLLHASWTVDDVAAETRSVGGNTLPATARFTRSLALGNHTIEFAADDAKPFGSAQCTAQVSVVTANQAIDFAVAGPFIYGDGPATLGATAAPGLPVTLTLVSGPATLSDNTLTITGAGTIRVRATQGGNSWRNPATPVTQDIVVQQAALTVTASHATRLYGGPDPLLSATIAGFVNREGETALNGTLTFTTTATSSSHVGTFPIAPSGLSAANYAITFVDGVFEIGAAPLTVTAGTATRRYGDPNPEFAVTIAGFVLGEDASVLTGTATFSTADQYSGAGSYSVTPSGLTSTDYAIRWVDGSLEVTRAPLKVTANDAMRLYGAPDPMFSASYDGLVLGEDSGVLGGPLVFSTAPSTSGVGHYAIGVSGLTSLNYEITFVDGTLTVTQAPLSVRAADATRRYGAANPGFAVAISGFVLADTESALGGSLAFSTAAFDSPVGTYPITPSGLTSSNYAIVFVDGKLTITQVELVVTAQNASRSYGSANPAFTVSLTGFVLGDDVSSLGGTLVFDTPAGISSAVGSYSITPSGLSSSNYAIWYMDGTLSVTPAPLTVRANDATRVFRAPNPVFTASYAGFVVGEGPGSLSGTLAFSTTATTRSARGSYPITPSGPSSTNYAIAFVDGVLNVTSRCVERAQSRGDARGTQCGRDDDGDSDDGRDRQTGPNDNDDDRRGPEREVRKEARRDR